MVRLTIVNGSDLRPGERNDARASVPPLQMVAKIRESRTLARQTSSGTQPPDDALFTKTWGDALRALNPAIVGLTAKSVCSFDIPDLDW